MSRFRKSASAPPRRPDSSRFRLARRMRPGNYVFSTALQVGLRATSVESCALSIVSMVVSQALRQRAWCSMPAARR